MRFRNLTFLALLVVAFVVPQATAQPNRTTADPQEKERKVRPEPDRAFTDWIRDVGPIISQGEQDAWKTLKTNEEREKFIEDFWHRRDPDPDTEENEYREEYYERVAYVNEHFSSGIPGYKTDRGRVYLKYGRPDEVESHPAGGAYQRQPWEGNGSTSTYPFERWFYRNIPGRSGADIEFVDPTGTGEYRLARNPFEKEALLNVPGAGATTDGVSQADRVAAANGVGNPFSMRAQDSPFDWMELNRILTSPPAAPRYDPFGEGLTSSPKIEDNPLAFDTSFGFYKFDDNRVITTVTVQTDNRELSFQDSGGVQVASVNITGRIVNVAGRRVNAFEDAVNTAATPAELIEAKEKKSAYQKTVVLPPGYYKADLMVRDTKSGATGVRHIGFTVPRFGSELSASSLILATVLEPTTDATASRQFVIGDRKVIPNIAGTFRRGAPVGIYMQIYNAGVDQTTLRPAVDVEYALLKDGKELQKRAEDWRGTSMNGDRLIVSQLIDSRDLRPGDYSIEVRVRDHVGGKALTQTAKFTVIP